MEVYDDGGEISVYTIIKTDGHFDDFDRFGIRANSRIGNVVTARLNVEQLDSLVQQEGILRIEPSVQCELALDTSLIAMGVSMAVDSFGLNGKGVIVGIIDEGIDIYNDDFSETNDTSKTRILYYFDVTSTGPSPFDYGCEYTKSEIDSGWILFHQDYAGHGTHVLGIAGGNGHNTKRGVPPGTYKGVAPEASIICFDGKIQGYLTTGKMIDGAYYISNKADSLNMPCVINFSVGTLRGPRDGTSPLETALSNLGSNVGCIIVVAAGNYNYDSTIGGYNYSRGHAIRYGPDTVKLHAGSTADSMEEQIKIQIWYPQNEDYYVTLLSPNNDFMGLYGPMGGTGHPGGAYHGSNGVWAIHNENFADTGQYSDQYPDTYEREIWIYLGEDTLYGQPWPITTGEFKIVMDSGQGRWDAYIYKSTTKNRSYFIDHQNEGCVHEPGNAECVITVGAFTSKNQWINVYSGIVTAYDFIIGDECYFSSQGPTRDGRNKPEILAPGAMIASSVSDNYLQTYPSDLPYVAYDSCHIHGAGTSAAAPHIAGLVVLMFQHDPDLDFYDVIDCLEYTAVNDKVDAYAALECIGATPCQGECGDATADGIVDVSDVVYISNYVFIGAPQPLPVLACGDANTDGTVNVSDAVKVLNYVFQGGDPPEDCSPGSPNWIDGDCCPFVP